MPMSWVLEGVSRQRKGAFLGTPGGADPPLTPTLTAFTPCPARMGMALRVMPGTSLCAQKGTDLKELNLHDIAGLHAFSDYARISNILSSLSSLPQHS